MLAVSCIYKSLEHIKILLEGNASSFLPHPDVVSFLFFILFRCPVLSHVTFTRLNQCQIRFRPNVLFTCATRSPNHHCHSLLAFVLSRVIVQEWTARGVMVRKTYTPFILLVHPQPYAAESRVGSNVVTLLSFRSITPLLLCVLEHLHCIFSSGHWQYLKESYETRWRYVFISFDW